MGLKVIAFSSSADKEADAQSFGATAWYNTSEVPGLKLESPLDLLFITSPQQPDIGPFLPLLAPRATIFPLTIGRDSFSIPRMPLLMGGITVQGSVVCPRNAQNRMIAFAARHGIKPQTQTYPMNKTGIEEGLATLASGKMKYRGVLVVPNDHRLTV